MVQHQGLHAQKWLIEFTKDEEDYKIATQRLNAHLVIFYTCDQTPNTEGRLAKMSKHMDKATKQISGQRTAPNLSRIRKSSSMVLSTIKPKRIQETSIGLGIQGAACSMQQLHGNFKDITQQ